MKLRHVEFNEDIVIIDGVTYKIEKQQPVCKIDLFGTKRWYLNGNLHREDGPAVEFASGTKFWYLNGNRHREDGPAVVYASGTKVWYLNDKLHREDGPAVIWYHGKVEYWIHGVQKKVTLSC